MLCQMALRRSLERCLGETLWGAGPLGEGLWGEALWVETHWGEGSFWERTLVKVHWEEFFWGGPGGSPWRRPWGVSRREVHGETLGEGVLERPLGEAIGGGHWEEALGGRRSFAVFLLAGPWARS